MYSLTGFLNLLFKLEYETIDMFAVSRGVAGPDMKF